MKLLSILGKTHIYIHIAFVSLAHGYRKLENQNKQLQSEKDEKYRETKELKRYNKPTFDNGKSGDRLLAAQLRHSQNQVRILKSTMEQFLRMGVFNDELPSNVTSPTT